MKKFMHSGLLRRKITMPCINNDITGVVEALNKNQAVEVIRSSYHYPIIGLRLFVEVDLTKTKSKL